MHITARIAELAGSNEILVSSTVRDLVVGSGFAFADRGDHTLKGVPESQRLFSVVQPATNAQLGRLSGGQLLRVRLSLRFCREKDL